ncbi:MAG TPA: RDD family protein [Pyrinomonadaceae bacterium]|nr:RDD family protein [Pyrinomonadaceae bacterium]
MTEDSKPSGIIASATESSATQEKASAPITSTLIEFPGVSRAARPQWRKDLSERVREIQERRLREAALEREEAERRRLEQPATDAPAPQLGLVPTPEMPELNPIVAAALARIERARRPSLPMPRSRGARGSGAAVARVVEEDYQTEINPVSRPLATIATPQPVMEEAAPQIKTEHAREHNLVVVARPAADPATKTVSETEPAPAIITVSEPEATAQYEEISEATPEEALYDDSASVIARIASGIIDLLVTAFAIMPFAAIIELTNGNWTDWRVQACMGGIVLVVMFLYFTAATALTGRTWGMSLLHLRAVDVDTGLPPTTKQSIGRALGYMISLPIFFGLFYALFDAEGRTLHDHISGTTVVRE